MTKIETLTALAKEATPGKWHSRRDFEDNDVCFINAPGYIVADLDGRKNRLNDASYIAAANPETLLSLLALVQEQHEALKLLRDYPTAASHAAYLKASSAADAALKKYDDFNKWE